MKHLHKCTERFIKAEKETKIALHAMADCPRCVLNNAAPKMQEALIAVKIRMVFIGHPKEPMNEDGPDWSKEIKLMEDAQAIWEGRK